jgi:hypothetical protein
MRTSFAVCLAACGVILAAVPVVGHHSFAAEFDASKPIKLRGSVTKVEWMNPHAYFYIDVTEPDDKVTNWALEMGSPNGLMREGWSRNTLKIGDIVTVEGSRAKDGRPKGNVRVVILASTGQRLFAASSQGNAGDKDKK